MASKTDSKNAAVTSSLLELLGKEDEKMKELFAKTMNLFVAPGASDKGEREKIDRLRQAVEASLK